MRWNLIVKKYFEKFSLELKFFFARLKVLVYSNHSFIRIKLENKKTKYILLPQNKTIIRVMIKHKKGEECKS